MIMQKKLFKIIYNYFPEADTDVDRWHEVIKTSGNNSSTFHLLNSVKYYVTYFSENNSIYCSKSVDFSISFIFIVLLTDTFDSN